MERAQILERRAEEGWGEGSSSGKSAFPDDKRRRSPTSCTGEWPERAGYPVSPSEIFREEPALPSG